MDPFDPQHRRGLAVAEGHTSTRGQSMVVLLVVLIGHTSPKGRRGGSPCCCCYLFSNQRSVCVALPFVAAQSSTLPRMRLLLRLPRLQRRRSWSSHHCRCRHLFRRWRHPLPVKMALDLNLCLLPFSRGHRRRCC